MHSFCLLLLLNYFSLTFIIQTARLISAMKIYFVCFRYFSPPVCYLTIPYMSNVLVFYSKFKKLPSKPEDSWLKQPHLRRKCVHIADRLRKSIMGPYTNTTIHTVCIQHCWQNQKSLSEGCWAVCTLFIYFFCNCILAVHCSTGKVNKSNFLIKHLGAERFKLSMFVFSTFSHQNVEGHYWCGATVHFVDLFIDLLPRNTF